jgi:SAM-dependent methyltransferase
MRDESLIGRLGQLRRRAKAAIWRQTGRRPDAGWAGAAKWVAIERSIRAPVAGRYGLEDAGLDERVVEYPWLFERLAALQPQGRALDAGSVLNFPRILRRWLELRLPPVSIVTLGFEGQAQVSDTVRYEFADLRQLPYRDAWFQVVLSLSTLEHVGLDNTIYGQQAGSAPRADPNEEAGRALDELSRVTAPGGTLLLSVPFGQRSNRGWFRVLDAGEVEQLTSRPGWSKPSVRHFRAQRDGWRECSSVDAKDAGYNEPRGGERTAPPYVAAAEAVALIEMTRAR